MNLELQELGAARVVHTPELRERAERNAWSEYRLQYLVRCGGVEVAFLSFDLTPGQDYLVLYELFLAGDHRRRGIGTTLLKRAEDIARARGLKRLLVCPVPLAADTDSKWLKRWYEHHGFTLTADGELLEKIVGL